VNAHPVDACPDAEELAGFLDGVLTEKRRAEIAKHVATCADCRTTIEYAAEVEQELPPAVAPAPRIRQAWLVAAAVLIAAIAAVVLYRGRADARDPVAPLVAAAPSSARSIEPRLCGGFRWAPLQPVRRSTPQAKTPEELIASGAAAAVLKEVGDDRSARSLHAAGVAYLVAGDARTAVTLLEDASRAADGNARVWSDLAAALYMAADEGDDDRVMMPRALAAADHAVRLNPRLDEAYFNRAVILERLGRAADAAAAWREYLARDHDSPWAVEARRRLAAL